MFELVSINDVVVEGTSGINKTPPKDELLLQGRKQGDLALRDPHSHTSFLLAFPSKKNRR